MAPNGLTILSDKVKRRFPADDTWVAWDSPRAYEYESSVAELIQEILQRHAEGIEFREYNVSKNLTLSEFQAADSASGWAQPRYGHAGRRVQPEDLG